MARDHIETLFQGDCVLILQDGTRLNAGRAYRRNLDELIGRGCCPGG